MLNNGKNTPLNGYCGRQKIEIIDIPISLHAKFQGNWTIPLGKNGNRQTDRNTERQKHRNTDLNFIKIDNQL